MPSEADASGLETATLAGGCFWCLEAVFEQMLGVASVVSGYTGGRDQNPDYRSVCTGTTGHAEAVRLQFDPRTCSYRDVLEVFFAIHDPTTLNRQGNDVGTQYRSAIFHHSAAQRVVAQTLIDDYSRQQVFDNPILTELLPATDFFQAEDEHHGYYRNHPHQPYCQYVVAPKLMKFRKQFASRNRTN